MLKFYFPLFFFLGISVAATAQQTNGQNPDANAPANLSDPALRPAQPAQYSATPVPNGGQFYVKDDLPASPQGQIISPLTPEQREARIRQKYGEAAAQPASPGTPTQKKR